MQESTNTFGDTVKFKNRPSLNFLNKLIDYDPLTGALIAKVDFGRKRKGDLLGGRNKSGLVITLSSKVLGGTSPKSISTHHLAYALTWGEWSKHSISHKDKDVYNNKWENLIVNKGMGIKDKRIKDVEEIKIVETVEKPDLLRCDRSALIDYILLIDGKQPLQTKLEIEKATVQTLFKKNQELLQQNKNQIETIQGMKELGSENKQLRKDFNKNSILLQNIYRLAGTARCKDMVINADGFGDL